MTWTPPWTDVGERHQILEPGCHQVSLADFSAAFAGAGASRARTKQLQDLLDYLKVLTDCGLVVRSVLVDGSFATGKPAPGDMDISPVVDGEASKPAAEVRAQVNKNFIHSEDRYKTTPVPGLGRTVDLDVYGFVTVGPGHPRHGHCQANEDYWREWWQRTRARGMGTKGYLEVMLP